MKISNISQQVKRRDRYSIYVDGAYSFSLSEAALVRSRLASGQDLDQTQLEEYKQLSADDKVYNRALRYVAMRPRSEWELRTYLLRKDTHEALIDQLLDRLRDLRLLDDAQYAISFVRDRQLLRPTSRRKLMLELKQKHINEEHIQAAFTEQELNETDSLRDVIAKKRRQSKYQDDEKLMQYLARQGFSYGDIKSALSADDED